jgi:hypothetical protein
VPGLSHLVLLLAIGLPTKFALALGHRGRLVRRFSKRLARAVDHVSDSEGNKVCTPSSKE